MRESREHLGGRFAAKHTQFIVHRCHLNHVFGHLKGKQQESTWLTRVTSCTEVGPIAGASWWGAGKTPWWSGSGRAEITNLSKQECTESQQHQVMQSGRALTPRKTHLHNRLSCEDKSPHRTPTEPPSRSPFPSSDIVWPAGD